MPKLIDQIVTESSLSETTLYHMFNLNGEMSRLIISAIQNSEEINESYIEDQLLLMKRSKFQLLDKVLEAYDMRDINIIFTKIPKFTQSLPFFTIKKDGKIKTYICVNNYGTIQEDRKNLNKKYLNIDMKTLYTLMEGAFIGQTYTTKPGVFSRNYSLIKTCCEMYTAMIMRILNKEFALSMDREAFANVNFLFAKFFLSNICELNNSEISFNYARSVSANLGGGMEFTTLDEQYLASDVKNIEDLINLVNQVSTRVKSGGLTLKYFTQRYLNTFKAPAIYSVESLPYFLFTIEATLLGSFIVNQPIIFEAIRSIRGVKNFYNELLRIVS